MHQPYLSLRLFFGLLAKARGQYSPRQYHLNRDQWPLDMDGLRGTPVTLTPNVTRPSELKMGGLRKTPNTITTINTYQTNHIRRQTHYNTQRHSPAPHTPDIRSHQQPRHNHTHSTSIPPIITNRETSPPHIEWNIYTYNIRQYNTSHTNRTHHTTKYISITPKPEHIWMNTRTDTTHTYTHTHTYIHIITYIHTPTPHQLRQKKGTHPGLDLIV